MEYGALTVNSTYGNYTETTMELDFMDELLQGRWMDSSNGTNLLQSVSSVRALNNDSSNYVTPHEINTNHLMINPNHHVYEEDQANHETFLVEEVDQSSSRKWWISPRVYPEPSSCVKERLTLALRYLKDCLTNRDLLIQMWMPVRRGDKLVLTTHDQPYLLEPSCVSLANYRKVLSGYEFAAEEEGEESVGLAGRAYVGKLPEWTPDVRYFKRHEYPLIRYAEEYNVRGSLALPVFERGSGACLGVVEIVTTTQRVNYRPELDFITQALESVDLRSFQNFIPPIVKTCDELYQAALTEILEVVTSVCKTHRLPLALTWAPCSQQGKGGCRHSDQTYTRCVSTVDSACFVSDLETTGFHEACAEHHLFRGQGIVGTAFTTKKPCFAVDVTAFSKTEYPLSHHARMFGLVAAVAIPLRSVYTGPAEFVLEFFLPKECRNNDEQKRMLNSLSIVIQQSCRSLHVVTDNELEEEITEKAKPGPSTLEGDHHCTKDQSSWIAHMMEAQEKGKGVSLSLQYQTDEAEEEREGFRVTSYWDATQGGGLTNGEVITEFGELQQSSGLKSGDEGGGDSYSFGSRRGGRKAGEKRRTKAEKTISLSVLRQYFAGSLKDAAKSIGVCPTTLKRICRQHGITRWPSRKIKKVSHSLRKLQLVIDSVQGAEGSIQISSFYKSFPELGSTNVDVNDQFSSLKINYQNQHQAESGLFSHGAPAKSPASSSSQNSIPTRPNHHHMIANVNAFSGGDFLITEDPVGVMNRGSSEEPFGELMTNNNGCFKVKANFVDKKIRFILQPSWGFRDLQLEIGRRFNLEEMRGVEIKYLDDDHELVLMTCDADLEECKEIYSSSQNNTIVLSLSWASHQNPAKSYGKSSPS